MKIYSIAFLLLASAAPAADASIDNLAERLARQPMWTNGLYMRIDLPEDARPEAILKVLFENVSLHKGKVTEFRVDEMKRVKIGNEYIGLRVHTNLGDLIVLLRFENPKNGWWERVFEDEQ